MHALQKRPTTPGKSTPSTKENTPPIPDIPTSEKPVSKEVKKEKRSSLAFLRRSKSGDTVRSRNAPPVPTILQQAPRLPDLWTPSNTNGSPPTARTVPSSQIRDSVDIVSGMLGIPAMSGRRSIDTGVSTTSSAPGGSYASVKSGNATTAAEEIGNQIAASMAHRGRYTSPGSTANPPRRVRRRKDPTPFK